MPDQNPLTLASTRNLLFLLLPLPLCICQPFLSSTALNTSSSSADDTVGIRLSTCYPYIGTIPKVTARSCDNLLRNLDRFTGQRHYSGMDEDAPWVWSDERAPCYVSLHARELENEGEFSTTQISWRASVILADCERSLHGGTRDIVGTGPEAGQFYVRVAGNRPPDEPGLSTSVGSVGTTTE